MATCSQPAPKQFALRFDGVTCIYHYEVWHVYNVDFYLLPITKIIAANITTFIKLNIFLKFTLYVDHPWHCGQSSTMCGQ